MKNLFIVFMSSLLLSSCIFDKKTEVNKNPQNLPFLQGLVELVDVHSFEPTAYIRARFYKEEVASKINRYSISPGLITAEKRGVVCQFSRYKKESTQEMSFLSVGKLLYAWGDSATSEIPKQSGNIYSKKLDPGVLYGEYYVGTAGEGSIKKFVEKLPMPQEITTVRVNGINIETDPVNIKKSEPLKIEWDALTTASEYDGVQIKLLTEFETEYVDLICDAAEMDIPKVDKKMVWEVPNSYLTQMQNTNAPGVIALVRYQGIKAKRPSEATMITLMGLRIHPTMAGVTD